MVEILYIVIKLYNRIMNIFLKITLCRPSQIETEEFLPQLLPGASPKTSSKKTACNPLKQLSININSMIMPSVILLVIKRSAKSATSKIQNKVSKILPSSSRKIVKFTKNRKQSGVVCLLNIMRTG